MHVKAYGILIFCFVISAADFSWGAQGKSSSFESKSGFMSVMPSSAQGKALKGPSQSGQTKSNITEVPKSLIKSGINSMRIHRKVNRLASDPRYSRDKYYQGLSNHERGLVEREVDLRKAKKISDGDHLGMSRSQIRNEYLKELQKAK